MSTKSNPKSVQTRKRSASKAPAARIGLTFGMHERPVYHAALLSGPYNEVTVWLQPVPYYVFFDEVKAMKHAGYCVIENDGHGQCPNCESGCAVDVVYFQRHRNGKKNTDTQRGFTFCFECNMVVELILTDVDHMPEGARMFIAHENQELS